jgi:hypothetical protein
LGWKLQPSGKWTGDYKCVEGSAFSADNATGKARIHTIEEVILPERESKFLLTVAFERSTAELTVAPPEVRPELQDDGDGSTKAQMSPMDRPGTESASTMDRPGTESASTMDRPGADSASMMDRPGTESASTMDRPGTETASMVDRPGTESMDRPGQSQAPSMDRPGQPAPTPELKQPAQPDGVNGTYPIECSDSERLGTIVKEHWLMRYRARCMPIAEDKCLKGEYCCFTATTLSTFLITVREGAPDWDRVIRRVTFETLTGSVIAPPGYSTSSVTRHRRLLNIVGYSTSSVTQHHQPCPQSK